MAQGKRHRTRRIAEIGRAFTASATYRAQLTKASRQGFGAEGDRNTKHFFKSDGACQQAKTANASALLQGNEHRHRSKSEVI